MLFVGGKSFGSLAVETWINQPILVSGVSIKARFYLYPKFAHGRQIDLQYPCDLSLVGWYRAFNPLMAKQPQVGTDLGMIHRGYVFVLEEVRDVEWKPSKLE